MAYVESFYLDANLDQEVTAIEKPEDVPVLHHLADQPSDATVVEKQVAEVSSDYCGFESEEMPPIYRAQLRQHQKKKLIEKEAKEKSQYAYHVDLEKEKEHVRAGKATAAKVHVELTSAHNEYYVPGFSPPQQNEEIHTLNNFALPKSHSIDVTEHVFQMASAAARHNDVSQYIPLPNEDGELLNAPKKSLTEMSAISCTDTGFSTTEESSILTAKLGPTFGSVPTATRSPAPKSSSLADKYKGLSAFRPVGGSIESRYAFPDLN